MIRRVCRKVLVVLVATAVSTVAVPGSSVAASAKPDADAQWTVEGGTGSAHARARASSAGRVELRLRTVGGKGHHGQRPRRSFATAEGSVTETVKVTEGTYRVRVTYAGISSRRYAEGRGGRLGVRRTTTADFVSTTGGGDNGRRTFQPLPRRGTASTDLLVEVVPGTTGRIVVTGEVAAWSLARGARARARAWTVVRDIRISVTRLS